NYRESLWRAYGGHERAIAVNRGLVSLVDVLIGNEEDFSAALGFAVKGTSAKLAELDPDHFKSMIQQVVTEFPNLQVVATTLRHAKTATINDWSALCWCAGEFFEAAARPNLEILDRIGGGDSFASGLAYGFLTGRGPQWAVDCGAAHGALAMTTPGDTSMATLQEVLQVMKSQAARIAR